MEEEPQFISTFKDLERIAEFSKEEDEITHFINKVYENLSPEMQNKQFGNIIKKIPNLNYRNPLLLARALEIWSKKDFKTFTKEDLRFESKHKANIYRYIRLLQSVT